MSLTTAFTDRTLMPFGKYKGKPMIQVPAPYLIWLNEQGCDHSGVRKYIQDNLEVLQQEASKAKR